MKNELVFTKKDQILTTSILIAKHYGKSHKHVIRDIDNLVKDLTAQNWAVKNFFIEDTYITKRGRKYPQYLLTKDGFTLLVMGYNGEKALRFKVKYINAFNLMEKALLSHQNASWIEAREQGKIARKEETDKIKEFVEYATDQGSQNAKHYYLHFTNATYKALEILGKNKATPIRDILDGVSLGFLVTAEQIVIKALDEGMVNKLHYKEIYMLAKQKLENFAEFLPKRKMLN